MMTNIAAQARVWDRWATRYAASPVKDVAGFERTLERTRSYLNASDRVIEIGCGTGSVARKLAPSVSHFTATDVSPKMIAVAEERNASEGVANVTYTVTVSSDPQWQESAFDAALAFNLLHLLPDRSGVLADIHRMLKPGGHLITKTPCLSEMSSTGRLGLRVFAGLLGAIGRAPTLSLFSAEELEREIETAGFKIIERDYHASDKPDIRPFLVAIKT